METFQHRLFDVAGEDGFARLVGAFYRRVRVDPILAPMYPAADFEGAEQRLRMFLIYRFGGPATYLQTRGHPRRGMRHAPFRIDRAARDRWFALMSAALDEAGFPPEADAALRGFFEQTATFLINTPEAGE